MRSVLAHRKTLPAMSRFGWLMALYGENFTRLQSLFDVVPLTAGRYCSSVGDSLDVHIDIIEQHAYTIELRMSYGLRDPLTGMADPSANLRLYRDAQQVEATHCYAGRRWQDVIGMFPPPHHILDHRLRMNTFLGKWLSYLAEQGHAHHTLQRIAEDF